jgi:cytochrome c oxidase subunit 1
MRLPFFVWAQFVTAFLLLLAFPPLEAAAVMQLMDKVAHTSFFLPTGLAIGGTLAHVSGGGSPLLWQHLFWFLAHPEVYVLILPAMGIVAEIIANNTRKPIWGYKSLVYSVLTIGFLSFIVWAHHMYLTGMGTHIATFFQTTTMIISIPSVIVLTCMLISLWGGSIRFNTPMLFVMAFLPMFGIGGLTGLPLGLSYSDIHLHDTYYVIAHFHYIVAPGTIFALFAGIYYWFPKMTGRMMSEFWGRVHFWLSLIFMNLIFQPMFAQGMAGMNGRRRGQLFAGENGGRDRRPEPGHHEAAHLHPLGGSRIGPRADPLHHQPFLEHPEREAGRLGQSLAGHHPGMADADAASARQFPQTYRSAPRAV